MTASPDESIEALRGQCAAAGFDLDSAGSALVERMRLLAECSDTFEDAKRMTGYAERVFRHYESTAHPFTALERQTVLLACLFSDIGKTGPADADADGRRLVVEAFAVENVQDETQSVERFFHAYFPADAAQRVARFAALGLDPAMSIRALWNHHAAWTLAIAEQAGLPAEATAAAATHHLLEDINPGAIVDAENRFSRPFGANPAFDRAEKLVIVLDKYDAVRRRGRRSHAEAIAWIRARIAKSPRFAQDPEFSALVATIDTLFGATAEAAPPA